MKFFRKLPQVEIAWFCMTLRLGSVFVAVANGFLALQSLVVNVLEICQIISPFQHTFNLNYYNETAKRLFTTNELLTDDIFMVVFEFVFLVTCALLYVGVLKEIHKYMFIWMVIVSVKIVIDLALVIVVVIFAFFAKMPFWAYGLFVLLLFPNAAFLIYSLIVIRSYYEKLEGGE